MPILLFLSEIYKLSGNIIIITSVLFICSKSQPMKAKQMKVTHTHTSFPVAEEIVQLVFNNKLFVCFQAMYEANTDVLKEPRGFIKFLQIVSLTSAHTKPTLTTLSHRLVIVYHSHTSYSRLTDCHR